MSSSSIVMAIKIVRVQFIDSINVVVRKMFIDHLKVINNLAKKNKSARRNVINDVDLVVFPNQLVKRHKSQLWYVKIDVDVDKQVKVPLTYRQPLFNTQAIFLNLKFSCSIKYFNSRKYFVHSNANVNEPVCYL